MWTIIGWIALGFYFGASFMNVFMMLTLGSNLKGALSGFLWFLIPVMLINDRIQEKKLDKNGGYFN